MNVNTTIGAGATLEFFEDCDFFRVMDAPDPLTIRFYRKGAEVARAEAVAEGYAEKFEAPFDRVQIQSATAQTVHVVGRLGNVVQYDKAPTGGVVLNGEQGAFTQTQATVTNASGQLFAANASRRYLLVQNNDASGDVYVTLDGTEATTAKGIKIAAGGSLELAGFCPSGAVFAIGSVASNANVVAVEG